MKTQLQRIRRLLPACFAALFLLAALPLTAGASGEPGAPGDITLDGRIDAQDYLLLKRHVLGTYVLNAAQRQCADLNRDGDIDVQDYLLLRRALLGTYTLPQAGAQNGNSTGETGGNANGETGDKTEEKPAEPLSAAQEVLRLVNLRRAENGLAPLTLSDKLCELAALKAEDMAANNYFDHTSPTYGTPFEMMKQFGVSYRSAGENIAAGLRTPEEVMDAWMNSPGHRANILSADYTELGVGVAIGERGVYWVQLFRMP